MSRKNVIANRYEVIQHIGQGGMADVFLAIDTILNRQVAIKILRSDLSTDAVSILRFEREAQAATALAHPNIVEVYDVGDYKGHHYIVMEYVPGNTLKQVIRSRGPLLNEEAVDIMKQMTSAVAEAHSRGIIHRDIKPQNVIVKADGSIRILDFGIATAKGSMQLTQANNVMGSVHYLAPELAKGDTATPQSDIYALGIVLYEMLAGDVPFKADQAVQVALKHMRDPLPKLRSINPTVPQSIENIVTRATAKNPALRYRSCDEMFKDLSTCLRSERLNEDPVVLQEQTRTLNVKQKVQEPAKVQPVRQKEVKKEDTKKKEPKPNKKLTTLLIVMIALLAIVAIFFSLVLSGVIKLGEVMATVPDLEGKTIAEAKEICEENNLVIDTAGVQYLLTNDTEKGIIIAVEPDIGTELEPGSKVTVTVSSGIGIRAKDYTNYKITDAEEEISQDYPLLKITVVAEESDAEPGTIIRQEQLEPGVLFNPESAGQITLVYSEYATIEIPEDIIGKTVNEAIDELENMGIVVRTSNRDTTQMSQEELDNLEIGVVVEVSPEPGTEYTQKEDNFVILYYY